MPFETDRKAASRPATAPAALLGSVRDRVRRELLVFIGFLLLTALMTWPWILHLRDAVPESADTSAHAYFLWWDYHQTFHDPLNLFHANIFYPYRYTLAFGEHDYGISLIFFPLFALGFRPLTVYNLAGLVGFAFTGYGTFRLARTLSLSSAVAWTAGIVLTFIPYRLDQMAQTHLVFAGWIPLTLEALVLFGRKQSWGQAIWLGFAFVMNALTSLTWFMLTLVPLALSAILVIVRYRAFGDRKFWLRSAAVFAGACLVLLPFLLPFWRVARLYGFVRTPANVQQFSARLINWLVAANTNRLWKGLGAAGAEEEMFLFPGLLPPLLALGALLLVKPERDSQAPAHRRARFRRFALVTLDMTAVVAGIAAVLAAGYGRRATAALAVLAVALIFRFSIAYPQALRRWAGKEKGVIATFRSGQCSELIAHATVWGIIGFMGSFGLNFFFHRALYENVYIFRSMRAAARWSTICYLGLALLAGLGAKRFAELLHRHWPGLKPPVVCLVIIAAILFEQRAAPLPLELDNPDPDELTLFLKARKMAGGIVELPAGRKSYHFMLRAADHQHPLVNARDSFISPTALEIESLTRTDPVPDRLLDLLEQIPVSYLTIHNSLVSPERRLALEDFVNRGEAAGRLQFIKSFENSLPNELGRNDLYAVTKTEPETRAEGPRPPRFSPEALDPLFFRVGNFQQTSHFLIYRLYRASYGRAPRFAEFALDAQAFSDDPARPAEEIERHKQALIEAWMNRPEFKSSFNAMSDEQYVDTLFDQAGLKSAAALRDQLLDALRRGAKTRANVLRAVVDDPNFSTREINAAFVLMHYFAYLKRDPDDDGYRYWLRNLNRWSDYRRFADAFAASTERQLKAGQR